MIAGHRGVEGEDGQRCELLPERSQQIQRPGTVNDSFHCTHSGMHPLRVYVVISVDKPMVYSRRCPVSGPRRVLLFTDLYICAKFGWNRCDSFGRIRCRRL